MPSGDGAPPNGDSPPKSDEAPKGRAAEAAVACDDGLAPPLDRVEAVGLCPAAAAHLWTASRHLRLGGGMGSGVAEKPWSGWSGFVLGEPVLEVLP